MKKNFVFTIQLILFSILWGRTTYNHPEIQWSTFETNHFLIHFYDDTESSAREGAEVAERIYPMITDLYNKGYPMIRYSIGDIGNIISKICNCGVEDILITNFDGRKNDSIF